MAEKDDSPGDDRDDRAGRLAKALRENLRRRKAQARARAADDRAEESGGGTDGRDSG